MLTHFLCFMRTQPFDVNHTHSFIHEAPGLDLRGPYCFSNDHTFIPNDRIFHYLNIAQNSPNLDYMSHQLKMFIIFCRPHVPPLGGTIIKKNCILAYNSHILCCTFKNLIHMFPELCWMFWYGPFQNWRTLYITPMKFRIIHLQNTKSCSCFVTFTCPETNFK